MRECCLERWAQLDEHDVAIDAEHLNTCTPCRTEYAWRERERAWFAQRARRTPDRPALSWDLLAARMELAQESAWQPKPPHAPSWWHRFGVALPAVAACLLAVLPVLLSSSGGSEALDAPSPAPLQACFATDDEVLRHQEAAIRACLIAPVSTSTAG